jgi:ribonuclease G
VSEEVLINVALGETRVALVDNGVLQEVYLERTGRKGIVGNIYRGQVARVLPGMQAAFVEIGLQRAAFIHVSDIALVRDVESEEQPSGDYPDISTLLREGERITVQVTKDPLGTKGARLTTNLSVSSRYLVYMPNTGHIGISQKIENEEERIRLKSLVEQCRQDEGGIPGGFIARTVAEGVDGTEILKDIRFLTRLWDELFDKVQNERPVGIIYEDLPLYLRTMRDLVRPQVEKVRIDSKLEYERLLRFTEDYEPNARNLIEYYDGDRPIFDLYSINDEIEKALSTMVQLKSGGSIVLEQTEAMTTIDVNTGGFVGHRNQEETIYKTGGSGCNCPSAQVAKSGRYYHY